MKIVRGRADARLLPSRHAFAIFRLAAWLRLRNAKPEPANVTLVIDPHQSSIDMYAVGIWYSLTFAAFLAWLLPWPLVIGFPLAVLLTPWVVQLPIYFVGAVVLRFARSENKIRVQSVTMMGLLLVLAATFARRPAWVRFVAWQTLAVFALNALAAVIVFLLRDRIAQVESRLEGVSAFES